MTDTAKQYFNQALKENGMTGGVMPFDPPIAGRVTRRYQELMRAAGLCPNCEREISACICDQETVQG
jgi:hypothetical protein